MDLSENRSSDEERIQFRRSVLVRFGASDPVADELLAYNASAFKPISADDLPKFPLPDEPMIAAWEEYAREAEDRGAIAALTSRLVQFRFPIAEGISETDRYRAASRKGVIDGEPVCALELFDPDRIVLLLQTTPAGRIPILEVGDRRDFVTLVQAFSARNEPWPVPDSMGACIVTGLNNWDRVAQYRRQWEAMNPALATTGGWPAELQRMAKQKELYQDRFIILSSGPYSGVPASEMGFEEDEWGPLSLQIRREHESTHYFTYRVLGAMRNNLMDEVIADYAGLVGTFGEYRTDFAKRFFGLESFPAYRAGGRLENYRGKPPLSDTAFDVLQSLVVQAIGNLSRLDQRARDWRDDSSLARVIITLGSLTLEELASDERAALLAESLASPRVTPGPPTHEMTVILRTQDADLDAVANAVSDFGKTHQIPPRVVTDINLVLDEVLSNVLKYGYVDHLDEEFSLFVRLWGETLELEVVDKGRPFNALTRKEPDTTLSLQERPIGGLGILLVKKLTDEQHYEYRDGMNRLILRRSIVPRPPIPE